MLALALLLLLPGLLVVRAPWTSVPALSLAFWVLSAAWPAAGFSRGRLVAAGLVGFGMLALLRLVPKHEVAPPPGEAPRPAPAPSPRPGGDPPRLRSAPSALVLAAGATLVAMAPAWHNAPGPRLAFQTTAARLALWRDGWPLSFEPLLPIAPFGAHAPAIAALAADVSGLSGLDPAQAVAAVVLAAAAATLVGLFALEATVVPAGAAVAAALAGLALVPWPSWLAPFGAGESLVALAFVLPACALLAGHASRSSAVAAGTMIAAASLAQPVLTAGGFAACALTMVIGRRSRPGRGPRLGLALGTALLLAAPGLRPLASALSWREASAIATGLPLASCGPAALALLLLVLGPVLARRALGVLPRRRAAFVAIAITAAAVLAWRVERWFAAGQLRGDERAALVATARSVGPLEAVCAPGRLVDWVPALAARAPGGADPWIPAVYAEEWSWRRTAPCREVVRDR